MLNKPETYATSAVTNRRRLAPSTNTLDLAIESDVGRVAVLLGRTGRFGLSRRRRHSRFRCAMMRSSKNRVGREKRHDHCAKRSRTRFHANRRFSADSLPLFGTMSNVTLAPSRRSLNPAFSTAEIWTKTSLPPPLSEAMKPWPLVALNHFTVPLGTSALPFETIGY
jgi:hypothetical protein